MKLLRYLLFVIVLLAPSSAWAAFVVTPITTASVNSGGASSITTSSFNVSANSWVYIAALDGSFPGTAQDSLGNNYTQSQAMSDVATGYVIGYLFYYSTARTGITVTYTLGGGSGAAISLISIAGSNGTQDTGFSNGASGTSTLPSTTGANAPTLSGELLIGFVGIHDIFGGTTFTQASSWSNAFSAVSFSNSGSTWTLSGGGYFINSGSSNQTYAPTLSQTAVWGVGIDALEPSSGPPPATNHFLPLLGVGQ